jgi:hypothetical protein
MKAPRDGKPKTAMVILAGSWAAAGANITNAVSASAAMVLAADRRIVDILLLLQVAVRSGGVGYFLLSSDSE